MSNFDIDPITEGVRFSNIANLENQNFHEVNGVTIQLSPLNPCVSPMRSVMFAVHQAQSVVMFDQEPPRILGGMEREYARSTLKHEMPVDSRIVAKIPKYISTMYNRVEVEEQPRETILYIDYNQALDNGKVILDRVNVDRVNKKHQTYGWVYNKTDEDVKPDDIVRAGTIFAQSPRVDEQGNYKYGLNLKTAVMSINEITEDGYVISRSAAKERMRTRTYIQMSFSFGRSHNGEINVPLNLYKKGPKDYQILPEIGEYVRDDNLIFATRTHDARYAGLDMSFKKLEDVDITHDNKFYLPAGYKKAKVVDMTISKAGDDYLNPIFSKKIDRLYKAQIESYRRIYDEYRSLKKKHPNLKLSPKLNVDIFEIMKELKIGFARKVTPSRKKAPQAEWTVDVLIECEMDLSIACKVSGHFGNKGVVVDIWDDERMPVDEFGTRAEFIIDGDSSGKRMNWPVLGSQYINAQLDQCVRRIEDMSDDEALDYLMGFYKAASPMYHKKLVELYNRKAFRPSSFIDEFKRYPDIHIPPYCPVLGIEAIDRMEKYDPLIRGPVRYSPIKGLFVTTEEKIIVADTYLMFLEKNGTEWSSVSSPRRQHFGLVSKLSNSNKHSMPWKEQPTRFIGEPEAKSIVSNCGSSMIGRVVNRPNDPIATQTLHHSIMNTKTPTDIYEAVDYSKHRTDGSRANMFVKHIFFCDGFELKRDITHVS